MVVQWRIEQVSMLIWALHSMVKAKSATTQCMKTVSCRIVGAGTVLTVVLACAQRLLARRVCTLRCPLVMRQSTVSNNLVQC
jgi:hypothetical protein